MGMGEYGIKQGTSLKWIAFGLDAVSMVVAPLISELFTAGRQKDLQPCVYHSSRESAMEHTLTASIVIITMDRPLDVLTRLDALLEQTRLPEEVILVDASRNSCLVADFISPAFEREGVLFVYERAEPSTSAQRNLGVERASGDVVFFLDDDIFLDPEYIQEVMSVYETKAKGSVGGVRGNLKPPFRSCSLPARLYQMFFLLDEFSLNRRAKIKLSGYCRHSCKVYSPTSIRICPSNCVSVWRDTFVEHLFDTTFGGYVIGEDVDLTWRLSSEKPIYQIPTCGFRHIESDRQSRADYASAYRWFYLQRYFFEKEFGCSAWRRLFRMWANAGYLFLLTVTAVEKRDFSKLKGAVAGLVSALPQRDDQK